MKIAPLLFNRRILFLLPWNINAFFSTRNSNSLSLLRRGSREIALLHRKRKEEKIMYGSMKKNKEGTLKKLADDSNDENVKVDSELWWLSKNNKSKLNSMEPHCSKSQDMDHSLGGSIKRMKLNPKDPLLGNDKDRVVSDVKEEGITESKRSDDVKEIVGGESSDGKRDRERKENKNDDAAKRKAIPNDVKTLQVKKLKVLNVRVNNTTSFPIFTDRKQVPTTTKYKLPILSISLKDDPDMFHYPSVTKILSATMSQEAQRALELWKMKMIREMGEEKFKEYQRDLLNHGTEFHSCIEKTLLGKKVHVPKHIQSAYNSLSDILNELEDIRAIESFVSHKDLRYKGKVDCVASYKGKLYAIDWKKSDKIKGDIDSTYDAPLQLAAYIGAINSSKLYPFTIDCGLVVVGYTTGRPANMFFLSNADIKTYWEKWLLKLEQYWNNV